MEQEVPAVDRAEGDPARRAAGQGAEQLAGGLDRILGRPDGAGEHVRRAARQRGQRGRAPGQAVGGLVQRAVTAEDDDRVEVLGGGVLGQPGGMAAPARFRHLDVVVGGQRLADDDAGAGGDGRR